jgi:hypothetical protein
VPISDLDRQLLLIQEVGDVDPQTGDPVLPTAQGSTGVVMRNIGRLWQKYADVTSDRLRDMYVQLEAQDLVIAVLERLVDFSTNNGQISVKLSQRVVAHQRERDSLAKSIDEFVSLLSKGSAPLVGMIAAAAPISPPAPGSRPTNSPYGPDANSPEYSGSPYWRRWVRRP